MARRPQNRPGKTFYILLLMLTILLAFALSPDMAQSGPILYSTLSSANTSLYLPTVFGPAPSVYIPAGTFFMGCDPATNGGYLCSGDDLPLHQVYLDPYYIDRAEVTIAEYESCVSAGACTSPTGFSASPDSAGRPIINVSWYQADSYCQWVGGRLPTEAEWEKAARGWSDTRAFPWGNANPTCLLLNATVNNQMCVGSTTPVGSYSPAGDSPYGLHDMAGNVYEWVNDWHSPTYYKDSPFSNPQGPATGTNKVRRGGAFGSYGNFFRVAARVPNHPSATFTYVGFRCAYDP